MPRRNRFDTTFVVLAILPLIVAAAAYGVGRWIAPIPWQLAVVWLFWPATCAGLVVIFAGLTMRWIERDSDRREARRPSTK